MDILVTGGAGFIGSHLVHRLLDEGHRVVVLDDESTGRRENVPADARYLRGDVTRSVDLEPAFSAGLDAVCHLAGQASTTGALARSIVDLQTNVEGTINVVDLCLKYGVPRLLFASSMAVYGRTETLPTPEGAPCQPISYNGISTYAAERYVHATAERPDLDFDFRVTSFRMSSVYGPGLALNGPGRGVLGAFIGDLLRGEPITIFGDGEQSRDFVYVDDVVDGWARALANPASYREVFNLGSGHSLTINELAEDVFAAFRRRPTRRVIVRQPRRPGEQRHVRANVARAGAALGWEPRTSFKAGLGRTVRWAMATRPRARSLAS